MKSKILGAFTGLFIGIGLLLAVPSVAQAATWSTYANAQYVPNTNKTSGVGKVYSNKVRINPPVAEVYHQRITVVVNKTKGKILASTTTDANINYLLDVGTPTSNSVARCQLIGPGSSAKGIYLCKVFK